MKQPNRSMKPTSVNENTRRQAAPFPEYVDSFTPAYSAFGLPVYVAVLPLAPFCETPASDTDALQAFQFTIHHRGQQILSRKATSPFHLPPKLLASKRWRRSPYPKLL